MATADRPGREMLRKRTPRKGIAPFPRNGSLPLSFAQRQLWFLDQLAPDNASYNLSSAARLTGHLDLKVLNQTISEIVSRHEILRTSFAIVGEAPAQIINPPDCVRLPIIDLGELAAESREAAAVALFKEEARRPFDLAQAPLLRILLVKLSDDNHLVFVCMHHIICDAWSRAVLFREVAQLYEAYINAKPSPLPKLPVQFADFACWQEQQLKDGAWEKQLAYWKAQLAGAQFRMNLPADRHRPAVQTFKGAKESFLLPVPLHRSLKSMSRSERVTLFMTLLTAFNILLHRYTGQDEIIVATPVAGRTQLETESLIGLFINNLILRTDLSGNPRFLELLRVVSKQTWAAYSNQELPFEKVVEALQPDRAVSDAPLIQVAFGLQNVPDAEIEMPGLRLSPVDFQDESARLDLTLWISESERGLEGVWTYSTELFNHSTITRMTGHYVRLLESIASEPDVRVKSLEMYTQEERAKQEMEQEQWEASSARKLIAMRRRPVSISKDRE